MVLLCKRNRTTIQWPADPNAFFANDLPSRLVTQDSGDAVERDLGAVRESIKFIRNY